MTVAPSAEWYPDPTGRHELRYWDGQVWTSYVADAGVQAEDPYDGAAVVPGAAPGSATPGPAMPGPAVEGGVPPGVAHQVEESADLTLRLPPEAAREAVARELAGRGFRMTWFDEWNAIAEKGSKAGNIMLGGWAQYFKITVQVFDAGDASTLLRLLREPVGYWGGVMGRARVSGTFKTVVNDLVTAFHAQGVLVGVDHQG